MYNCVRWDFGRRVDQGPLRWAIRSEVIRWLIYNYVPSGDIERRFCNTAALYMTISAGKTNHWGGNLGSHPVVADPWEGKPLWETPDGLFHKGEFMISQRKGP